MKEDAAIVSDSGTSLTPKLDYQPAASVKPGSLKNLVMRGSMWTLMGYGASQVLRLGSNLILTRLLFPEAFGVMALVSVFLQGLQMFSDVGIGPSIIQSRRGDDPTFLNTAWTIQACRGVVLWLCSCIIALPVSRFYHQPELALLIPVAALSALISGFNSTALFSLNRHIALGRLTFIDLTTQVMGICVNVAWAVFDRSPWALVMGGIAGTAAKMIWSHTLAPGMRNRFTWDREASAQLFRFGRWIFLTTVITFLSRQSDRLLLGRYMSLLVLGLYGQAYFLTDSLAMMISTVSHRVLYPAMSRVARDESWRLREVYHRVRLRLDVLALPVAGAMMTAGHLMVRLLFDKRYAEAGWMVKVLALRAAVNCTLAPAAVCLMAVGRVHYGAIAGIMKAVWLFVAIPVTWWKWGVPGVVWAVALSEAAMLPAFWWGTIKQGFFSWSRETLSIALVLAGAGVGQAIAWAVSHFAR